MSAATEARVAVKPRPGGGRARRRVVDGQKPIDPVLDAPPGSVQEPSALPGLFDGLVLSPQHATEQPGASFSPAASAERKPVAGTDEHSSEESPAEAPGEEGPPPEVGILLERMNTAAEDVNNLEAQLLSTQKAYEQNAEAWSEAVLALQSKIGQETVNAVRPYFHGLDELVTQREETAAAAERYRASADVLEDAKTTLAAVEMRNRSGSTWGSTNSDVELLSELNAASCKVVEAQKARDGCEAAFKTSTEGYRKLSAELDEFRKEKSVLIEMARPLFQMQDRYAQEAKEHLENRQSLRRQIRAAKTAYSRSMQGLEAISNAVHEQRASNKKNAESGQPTEQPAEPPSAGQPAVQPVVQEAAIVEKRAEP
jgi:chromosome segregation ATPase